MVTADTRALVCVWDAITGERLMEFSANLAAEYVELELTAMSFDTTYRRLLTALTDGSLAIWNFNNGNCLKQVIRRSVAKSVGCFQRLLFVCLCVCLSTR